MIPALPAGAAAPAVAPSPAPSPASGSFAAVLQGVFGRAPPAAGPGHPAPGVRPAAEPSPPSSPCARLLEIVDQARARLDGVLAAARSGRTFTAQELLGLQAEAYRTVQTVDLGVKLAEQGAQSVRQALSTQV